MRRHPFLIVWLGLALALITAEAAAQSWPDLSNPGPAQGGGERDAALIIGVGDYVFAPDIEGATASAQDWYVFLTRTRQIPVGNVALLRDAEGTRESLLEAAAAAASRVGRGGTLWFIYIGHGAPAADGKEGVLVGADAQRSASSLYARSVRQSELFDLFEQGKQARTVAVLDACFSGQVGGGDALVPGLQPFLPAKAPSGDALVLTAGSSDEFAGPLPGAKRPAFSYLTLGALRGWADANGDGRVTGREATDYTRDALRVLLRDRAQTPAITGPGQDEPLAQLAVEAGPDLAELVLGGRATPEPQGDPPAPSPTPSKPDVFGGGLGFARLSFGLNSFGAGSYSAATTEAEVKHSQDSIFTTFPLDVTDAGALSLQGVGLDLMLGQEGLLLGASMDLLWLSGDPVPVRISTAPDSFSEGVPELVQGVDGTLTDYLRFDVSASLGYRVLLGPLGLFVQGGVGISFASLELSFQLDGLDNTVSTLEPQLVVPLEVGADFLLYKNLFVHAVYSFYAVPSGSQSFSGGIGILY